MTKKKPTTERGVKPHSLKSEGRLKENKRRTMGRTPG